MANLQLTRANVDTFIEQTRREKSELDMNERPEASHIQDPEKRKQKAFDWRLYRLQQLNLNRERDERELITAVEKGYLTINDGEYGRRKLEEVYDGLQADTQRRYEEAIAPEQPIVQ